MIFNNDPSPEWATRCGWCTHPSLSSLEAFEFLAEGSSASKNEYRFPVRESNMRWFKRPSTSYELPPNKQRARFVAAQAVASSEEEMMKR